MVSKAIESLTPPKERLVAWMARLYRHNLTTTTGGNLSMIDDDGTLYITPSGGDKAIISPGNIAYRYPDTDKFEGPLPPSMEWPLHTGAYRSRPDCRAVLHAHSMTLISFSIHYTSSTPDTTCLLGTWQSCGEVRLAPYAMPGSMDLASNCTEAIAHCDCVIMQNHGVVTVGKTLQEAYDKFVSLEYLARSLVSAIPLGMPIPLPDEVLDDASSSRALSPARKRSKGAQGNAITTRSVLPSPVPICPSLHCCCPKRIISGVEKEARATLCKFVKRAYDQSLVTSTSGCFSKRIQPRQKNEYNHLAVSFLVTPTGADRCSLSYADLCFVSNVQRCSCDDPVHKDTDAPSPLSSALAYHPTPSQQDITPSRASALHASIYSTHPEIHCIIIVTPPNATAYCITGMPFNAAGIPESHVVLRDVQTLPLSAVLEDNGLAVARALDPKNGKHTVLIQNYGLLSTGSDFLKTFVQVEVCESMCGVMLTAMRRGTPKLLSREEVHKIDEEFKIGH